MTKVQLEYNLRHPLDEKLLDRIDRAHGHYGITRIKVLSDQEIAVEFDASRLMRSDVAGVLANLGIPASEKPAPPPPEVKTDAPPVA
jgi:hypothetical protein